MKKIILLLFAIVIFGACNDDFLDRAPINSQTEATAFRTYDGFQTYAWSMYPVFTKDNLGSQGINSGFYRCRGDQWAGYMNEKGESFQNQYGFNTILVPSTDNAWDFAEIRRANIMLQNIDQAEMTDKDKAHWRGVGVFFRAYNYVELLSRYGDVPWLEKAAQNESDDEVVYASRTSRVVVADKIVADLEYAIANIKEDGDGHNTINSDCARALLSRFGLFEGTWRKNHATDESGAELKAVDLLNKAAVASKELMAKYSTMHDHFNGKYLQIDLNGTPGIILYKEYITSVVGQNMSRYERNEVNRYETHQAIIDMYLCADGKPISSSNNYAGAGKSVYHEFRNRDPRLLLTFIPPYFDSEISGDVAFTPPAEFNINPMEYKSVLEQLNPASWTQIPLKHWNEKFTLYSSPNINGIVLNTSSSRTGYVYSRHFTREDERLNGRGQTDKPIFFMEEVLLNYAELMHELGRFDQEIANITINLLRQRVRVPDMVVGSIGEAFDPKRDNTVDPIMWEIRRERIVELMGEGFGFNDIRRWKRASWFINRPFMGVYMRRLDYTNSETGVPHKNFSKILLTEDGNASSTELQEGHLYRSPDPRTVGKGWKDTYYLFPIPSTDLLLNPKLEQNPGWDEL